MAFIIVKQYTEQRHAEPKRYMTRLQTDAGVYDEKFGNILFPVFEDEKEANVFCDEVNSRESQFSGEFCVVPIEIKKADKS